MNALATTTPTTVAGLTVDREAILRSLKLDPRDPNVQALVLVCQTYGLDPVLKHMVLIQGTPYVTARGLWHIAHRSGLLDGWEVLEQGETGTEWWAKVQMRRKDMAGAWVMVGRYPKTGTNKAHGPEMAVTRAEVHILRRMFDVSANAVEEMDFDRPGPSATAPQPESAADSEPLVSRKWINGWFARAGELGIDGDELRHAIVAHATNNRVASIGDVRVAETKAVKDVTEAVGRGELALGFDGETGEACLVAAAPADDPGAPF